MSRKLFTDEQLLFLKNNAEGMTSHELTAAYNLQFGENRSRHTIRSTLSHNGWIGKLRPAGEYTDAQLSYLYANRDKPYTQLVESFNHRFGDNRTANGIKNALERRGWRFNHAGGKTPKKNKAQVIVVAGKRFRLDVYVWECVNGPVPPGYGVIHLDNDMRNNAISNLAVAPLIVRSMFVKAGFDSVPAAFSPALYASLILKTAVKTRRRRIY